MSFDYIVIGAGSAGSAVAARLSEGGTASVLLLEAGPADTKREIHVPAMFPQLFKSEVDWAYETEPQAALNGRRYSIRRGKMLGGCSSINAMIYQRGNPKDYDHWASLGNQGWSYADLLPLFKRSENFEPGASEYHGVGGPLNVADLRDPNPLSRAFIQACQQVGLPLNDDHNGAAQEGFGFYRVTQKDGQRHSTAAAYLKPAMSRDNLRVETDALASRLLFDGKRCTGVAYLQKGQAVEATANREVIVSSGAINSPQLLMLSGIGDGDHLRSMGIPVIHHLPGVGQNLFDHLIFWLSFVCNAPITLAVTSNLAEAGGFTKVLADLPAPDLQFHFLPSYFVNHGFDNPPGHGFSIGATLVWPKSVGCIKLRTGSPMDYPAIQPNLLAHEDDMTIFWRAQNSRAGSPPRRRWQVIGSGNICPASRRRAMTRCAKPFAVRSRRSITRWAHARWGRTPWPWSTTVSKYMASTACESLMHPSCPPSSTPTQTSQASSSAKKRQT